MKLFEILRYFLFFSLFAVSDSSWAAGPIQPIKLDPVTTQELNRFLLSSEGLHSAFFRKDEIQIDESIRKLTDDIERAERVSLLMNEFQRQHLTKIFQTIRLKLEMISTTFGETRKIVAREAFEQIAHIPRTYSVHNRFKIHFCGKDRSSWVQSGAVPRNPINPDQFGDCGKPVN